MKKRPIKPAKTISNRGLVLLSLFILLVISGISVIKLYPSQYSQGWLKLPAALLSKTIKNNWSVSVTPADQDFDNRSAVIPILTYHHVGFSSSTPGELRFDLTVTPENFELQMAWLKGQGFQSIVLEDLRKFKNGDGVLPEKPAILTFDDGYSDTFEYAVPILKNFGYLGSFAVITQFTSITQGDNQYASWAQIKRAKEAGMEIISHTQDHFNGTNPAYGQNFILRNLTDAKKDLRDNLGIETSVLVYPYGLYNAKYLKLAKQAGYEIGLTTKPGQEVRFGNLLEIPRLKVSGSTTLEEFQRLISDNSAR